MRIFTMRAHAIAACVTAAVLSSGLVSALGARTPNGSEASAGSAAGPSRPEMAELSRTIDVLHQRVAALEAELARTRTSAAVAPTVTAPFTVVNGAGTPIFTVTDAAFANATGRGRVHIGRGSSANYGMWFTTTSGAMSAQIGEAKTGAGVLLLNKGATEIISLAEDGLIARNSAGKQIAHLGPDPTVTTRGRLVVRGVLSLTDANDITVVDAGALPTGAGAVRTWPNRECKSYGGLRSPNCLMGEP
jgi:hypothetical protein